MPGEEQFRCPSTNLQPRQGGAAPLAVSTPCPQEQQPHSNSHFSLGESRYNPSQPEIKLAGGGCSATTPPALLVKAVVFPVAMYGCESWTIKALSAEKQMLLNCGVGEDSLKSLDCKEVKPVHPKGNQP